MSWLFGVKKEDIAGGMLPPPPEDQGGQGGGQKPPQPVGAKSDYHFDSTALERAAKAAKDLEQSSNLNIHNIVKPVFYALLYL